MDEMLCEVGVYPPVTDLTGVCEGVAGDAATDSHMIAFPGLCTQADFGVAQAGPKHLSRKFGQQLACTRLV